AIAPTNKGHSARDRYAYTILIGPVLRPRSSLAIIHIWWISDRVLSGAQKQYFSNVASPQSNRETSKEHWCNHLIISWPHHSPSGNQKRFWRKPEAFQSASVSYASDNAETRTAMK